MPLDANSDFKEYRRLIISELERLDKNTQDVHKAVSSNDNKLVEIQTALTALVKKLDEESSEQKELEIQFRVLEKEFSVLKTKVVLIGGAVGTVAAALVSVIAKWAVG